MSSTELHTHCRHAVKLGRARLAGWRLIFTSYSDKREGGIADIVRLGSEFDTPTLDPPELPREGDTPPLSPVWGVLWEVPEKELQALHRKEGYAAKDAREKNLYVPASVDLLLHGAVTRRITAFAYELVEKRFYVPPGRRYRDAIIAGAKENDIPAEYVNALSRVAPWVDAAGYG